MLLFFSKERNYSGQDSIVLLSLQSAGPNAKKTNRALKITNWNILWYVSVNKCVTQHGKFKNKTGKDTFFSFETLKWMLSLGISLICFWKNSTVSAQPYSNENRQQSDPSSICHLY